MAASFKLRRPLDLVGVNQALADLGAQHDIVWIDKGITIRRQALVELRRRNSRVKVIGYSPDNMAERCANSAYFLKSLPEYDAFITTKSFGVAELADLGARHVIFSPNAFDPLLHRPSRPTQASPDIDVGFIGTFERARSASIAAACAAGIRVAVFGNGWGAMRRPLPRSLAIHAAAEGRDYARSLSRFRIALCFLRRLSRDLQTTRSVEIPAIGSFMLAERTDEHRALFTEGVEAEYFSSDSEMIEKIGRYLADDVGRRRIAEAGMRRAWRSGYSYASRIFEALRSAGIESPNAPPSVSP